MVDLYFSQQANEALKELERTPTRKHLLGRLYDALEMLETDPRDVRCKRRRFDTIGCWAITVISNEGDWLILWDDKDELTTDVYVRAIIPDP